MDDGGKEIMEYASFMTLLMKSLKAAGHPDENLISSHIINH